MSEGAAAQPKQPRCGYTVVDRDGIEQPCDRPATGWRWYQDVEHEDMLDVACDWHANIGGQRIVSAEERAVRAERELAELRERLASIDGKFLTQAVLRSMRGQIVMRPEEFVRLGEIIGGSLVAEIGVRLAGSAAGEPT
jgi:hypothetical protein